MLDSSMLYNRSVARVNVLLNPHRLRHTCATQLLNASCRITSIQKFLGHKRLNTTLTYARAHDQTVADDYYQAMHSVEKRLELMGQEEEKEERVTEDEREQILSLTKQLAEPELSVETRLVLLGEDRALLLNNENVPRRIIQDHPPPLPAFYGEPN
ncbi:MAG: tyrosine-type recombinase/integrase [Bellilinea sp.]